MEYLPPQTLHMLKFPRGDYNTWSEEEIVTAEAHARAFAAEYIKDFDSWNTCIRLGYSEKAIRDGIGKVYLRHFLVQSYIQQLLAKFEDQGMACRDRLLAAVYRDASDFSPSANAIARVNAQKTLATLLGLDVKKKEVVVTGATALHAGGVMLVPAPTAAEWERTAEESQRSLKEAVKK